MIDNSVNLTLKLILDTLEKNGVKKKHKKIMGLVQ